MMSPTDTGIMLWRYVGVGTKAVKGKEDVCYGRIYIRSLPYPLALLPNASVSPKCDDAMRPIPIPSFIPSILLNFVRSLDLLCSHLSCCVAVIMSIEEWVSSSLLTTMD